MKQRILLSINIVLTIGVFASCGEKEDRDILDARLAIAKADYTAVQSAVEKALASDATQLEAQCLNLLLELRVSANAGTWQRGLITVMNRLETLNQQIQEIANMEDPDSDELDRQERLIRSRNSIGGFLAHSFAASLEQDSLLLKRLADQTDPLIITALLESQKCFQPEPRQTAARLIQGAVKNDTVVKLLIQSIQSPDPRIRQSAIKHLGNLNRSGLIPIFESVLRNKSESPDVIYSVIIALEKLKGQATIPALRLATRTNSTQARTHAAKLLGHLKAENGIGDLIRLLADANLHVKNSAIAALIRLGSPAIGPLIQVLDSRGREVLPDKNAEFLEEHQYIANAFIDDARLKDRRIGTQKAAIQVLGTLKAEAAISSLIKLLTDDDLHGEALDALVVMGGTAVPHLVLSLEHQSDEIRISATQALSRIGDRRAIKPLMEVLKNSRERKEAKAHAAAGLGEMRARGPKNTVIAALTDALRLDETTATNAAIALGQINVNTDEVVQGLTSLAIDKQQRETVRTTAISSLGQLKSMKAVQPLMLMMLSDETTPVIRKGAVEALGEIKAQQSIPALLWILSTQYDEIKDFQRHMKRRYKSLDAFRTAIQTLQIEWTSDYPQPVYRTWGELKSIPSLVRSEVALTLGKIKGELLFDSTQLIEYQNDLDKSNIPEALGQEFRTNGIALGHNITVSVEKPAEIWILTDRENQQHYHCRKHGPNLHIYSRSNQVTEVIISALNNDERATVRSSAAQALGVLSGKSAVSDLLSALKDEQGIVRQEAAKALGKIGDARIIAPLLTIQKRDRYESARREAAIALRTLNTKQSDSGLVDVLKKGLGSFEDKHEVDTVMAETTASLKMGGGLITADLIQNALKSADDEWTRWALVETLGGLEHFDEAKTLSSTFQSELTHTSPIVRKAAVSALVTNKDPSSVDELIKVLEDETEYKSIRAEAATTLGTLLDDRASAPLMHALDDESAEIREKAAAALGILKNTKSVAKLIMLLQNPLEYASVRAACVAALGLIGDKMAEPELLKILDTGTVLGKDKSKIPESLLPIDTLRTENATIYTNTITALGQLKSTSAVPKLIQILENRGLYLKATTNALAKTSARVKAAEALGEIGDPRAAGALARRIADKTEYIVAIEEITETGDQLKRNWSWEAFVGAAKPFQLPAFVAPKMLERIKDRWEDEPVKLAASSALALCE